MNFLKNMTSVAILFTAIGSQALAAEKVNVAYLPSLHGLPLFVALEEKLFDKAGLDVTATKFENPNQIIDALIAGRTDSAPAGGAAGITALAETRFPGALRVFGLQGSSAAKDAVNDAIIVKKGSPIRSIADLKGKRLLHAPGVQWRTIARTIVSANGMDPDKDLILTEMAIGLHAQAVISGTADAALALEPVPAVVATTDQIETLVKDPAGKFIADPFYAGAGVVSTRFITERPDVAKKFIAVMDQAVDLISKDFKSYSKYLVGYTAVTSQTVNAVQPMYYIGSQDIGTSDIAAYQKFADAFVTAGAMKKKVDVSRLIFTPN